MSALLSVRELRALDIVDVVPAGCFGLLIKGEAWAPHLRPSELAIVIQPTRPRSRASCTPS